MRLKILSLALIWFFAGCGAGSVQRDNPAAVASFLTELNEKVTGYMYGQAIPDDFDKVQYKVIVSRVCDHPKCQEKSDALFAGYAVETKKVDGFFSVLLCDLNTKNKVMEDYSCNNMNVEIRTWEAQEPEACKFADNWRVIYEKECR